MGLVISPNLQTRAYGACERPPVSPDFRVPPHLQTPGSVTAETSSMLRHWSSARHTV